MDNTGQGKTAIYVVLFFMSLIMHIQFPIFTPYAVALGATTFFISILLSVSSLANLCGNLIAGPFIDKFGKKQFIVVPLFLSAFIMIAHGFVSNPESLLVLRLFNGFVLAFLTPACFALLSGYAKNSHQQGKNMAVNGLLITVANIVAPLIGGYLVEYADFRGTYLIIGTSLLFTAVTALLYIKEMQPIVLHKKGKGKKSGLLLDKQLLSVYFVGFALMYAQGTLIYELPFLVIEEGLSTSATGKLFSLMGIGTLIVVCMLWINRISAFIRTVFGMLVVGMCFYQMVIPVISLSLSQLLLLTGMGLGVLFPAITTLLTEKVEKDEHGTAFGILSAVFSLGIVASSLVAGAVREVISPYFIAFLVMIISVTCIGLYHYNLNRRSDLQSVSEL
ncbi:MFS transporter [Halobacillus shinanisalinarum]|uniref:MFS transporter n=1 Tax=Halobacillus shinanisalinarum TaxID=2932258 RepID=A0ABY4GY55_9BACI|nr:MFS transporter [Halobacillus shinanisalinarum]UOQ92886.1 MFS transporter [Halobacillus shinanisalinarum]